MYQSIIMQFQEALNAHGENLVVDGVAGPKTIAALRNYEVKISLIKPQPVKKGMSPVVNIPIFNIVKGVKYKTGKYKNATGHFEGLVVHYTVSGNSRASAIGVVKYLASKGLGCMVMDGMGIIHIPEGFNIFTDSAGHAGKSGWNGRTGLNSYYAGMEVCCLGKGARIGPLRESKGEENIMPGVYQEFTPKQEKALRDFCLWAALQNETFKLDNVCGHDEARAEVGLKGDKSDPGASLSMTMPKFRKLLKAL